VTAPPKIQRDWWVSRIYNLLQKRNLLWLSGVRRVGKTTLCESLDGVDYFDCELPSVRRKLEDPELFFRNFKGKTIVLDEVHRLLNPSEVLKIGADHFKSTKIIATGSSTLAARVKFKDTLTGRKNELWLTPAIYDDWNAFDLKNMDQRMIRGGLPPFLLQDQLDDRAFIEWIDSYWSKDLQELFVIEKKASFIKLMQLIFLQSGELFEAQSMAAPCEISRQTVMNYLEIMVITLVVTILRPFAGATDREIKAQPKVYGFDTGFISYFRGWLELRDEDKGNLWEHLVLNELTALFPHQQLFYWRDKQGHEVDFIIKPVRGKEVITLECKSKASQFSPGNLKSFRGLYEHGKNYVACRDVDDPFERRYGDIEVKFVGLKDLRFLEQPQADEHEPVIHLD